MTTGSDYNNFSESFRLCSNPEGDSDSDHFQLNSAITSISACLSRHNTEKKIMIIDDSQSKEFTKDIYKQALALIKDPLKDQSLFDKSEKANPLYEEFKKKTFSWVRKFNLFEEPFYTKFTRSGIVKLASSVYPDCDDVEKLAILSDFIAFLYKNDDVVERLSKKKIREINTRYIDFLDRIPTNPNQNKKSIQTIIKVGKMFFIKIANRVSKEKRDLYNLNEAFQDVITRLSSASNEDFIRTFKKNLTEHFTSTEWEAEIRDSKRIPSLDEYIIQRRMTGAVLPCLYAGQIAKKMNLNQGSILPNAIVNQYLLEIITYADDLVCHSNDILSVPKDLKDGMTSFNLVFLIQKEEDLSFAEAISRAVEMHNNKLVDFLNDINELFKRLDSDECDHLLKEYKENIKKFVKSLFEWVAGHYTWAINAARYKMGSQSASLVQQ